MEKIEFYKNRTLSERFSVAIDFLKQNWKVLYKNILIGALPLAIIGGFFMQFNMSRPSMMLFNIIMAALGIYLNAMTGAVLKRYDEGKLTSSTGWGDLNGTMFSLSGKSFAIGLIAGGAILLLIFVLAIFGYLTFGDVSGTMAVGLVIFIMLAILLVFLPSLSLVLYPAYFSGTGNRESIKIAFGMGFRNWGSVFVTLLLAGIVLFVIIMIFSIPNFIVLWFSPEEVSILTFIVSFIVILGEILTYPIMFIFLAFQYFSIVEKEQGVSLQSQVGEFENL